MLNCCASRPQMQLAADITATQPTIPLTLSYADCEIDLNSAAPLSHRDWFKFPEALKCDRCRVIYGGGPIPLFGTGMKTLKLNDCIFEVHATPDSPEDGKNLIEAVLESKDQGMIQYSAPGE